MQYNQQFILIWQIIKDLIKVKDYYLQNVKRCHIFKVCFEYHRYIISLKVSATREKQNINISS